MTEFEARKRRKKLEKPIVAKLKIGDPRLRHHPVFRKLIGKDLLVFGVTKNPDNGPPTLV